MRHPPRLRLALSFALCVVAAAAGVVLGRAGFAAMDPHAELNATANVVYVGDSCEMSDAALRLIGDGPIVPLPVHPHQVAGSAAPCAKAMRHLRGTGSPLWSVVPDGVLCSRLVKGARDHLANTLEGNIPAWSLYGAYLGAGMTPEIVAVLGERQLLPPGASLENALAVAPAVNGAAAGATEPGPAR